MRDVFARLVLAAFVACCAFYVGAREAAPLAEDPALEARVQRIATELRCLVCQNETLADSQADLAADLRKQIREKLKQGMSDEQIRTFMVERYGDFVLYRPPVKSTTIFLWAGPFLLLVVGAIALARYLKLRRRDVSIGELGEADAVRARQLLDGEQ